LAEKGLTSMMVLHDYLSKCIAPFQECVRPSWMYTRVNDATRLERSDRSKLSPDPSSAYLTTHLEHCLSIYTNQAIMLLILKSKSQA
jgi:hypothetical protein